MQIKFAVDSINVNRDYDLSVNDVYDLCEEILNLPDLSDCRVLINGASVSESDYVVSCISGSDIVEFVKASGVKGAVSTITVTSGANRVSVEINDGATVSSVLRKVSAILGTDGGVVRVNGVIVDAGHIVQNGDRLEISKAAGSKGC